MITEQEVKRMIGPIPDVGNGLAGNLLIWRWYRRRFFFFRATAFTLYFNPHSRKWMLGVPPVNSGNIGTVATDQAKIAPFKAALPHCEVARCIAASIEARP